MTLVHIMKNIVHSEREKKNHYYHLSICLITISIGQEQEKKKHEILTPETLECAKLNMKRAHLD